MTQLLSKSLIAGLLIAISQQVSAAYLEANGQFYAKSDWNLVQETDALLQTPVCRISTVVTTSLDPMEFSITFPKDVRILPYLSITKKVVESAQIAVKSTDAGAASQSFFLLKAGTESEPNQYWYVPRSQSELIQFIRAKMTLELALDPKGAATGIQVSLRGSANALDQAAECVGKETSYKEFFTLLNQAVDLSSANITDHSVAALFASVQQTYDSYLEKKAAVTALEKFQEPYANLVRREKNAIASVNDTKAVVDKAKAKLDAANALVVQTQANIATGKSQLESLKTQKASADQELARTQAIYQPLKAQMKAADDRVAAASLAVQTTQKAIADHQARIAKNTKRIPQLQSELEDIRNEIPGVRSRISDLQSRYSDADRDYRNYDVNRKAEEYRNNAPFYSHYRWQLDSARRDLNDLRNRSRDAEMRLRMAEDALNRCRNSGGGGHGPGGGDRPVGPGHGGPGDPGGPGGPPNPPPPPPPPNCGSQEAEVNARRRDLESLRWNERSKMDEVQRLERDIRQIEEDARNKAENEADSLRRRRDDYASSLSSAQNHLSELQDRRAEINDAIPRLQQQINDSNAALPGLGDTLNNQQIALRLEEQSRQELAVRIGFPKAEADYMAALQRVNELAAAITAKTAEVTKAEKDLVTNQKAALARNSEYQDTLPDYNEAVKYLQKTQDQLKPYREKEGPLADAIRVAEGKLVSGKARYQALYKELFETLR